MEKTTLELPRKEWKKYNPFIGLERSLKKDHIEVEQRKSKAWEIALQAANLLKNNFGAQKVLVFGSLARKTGYHFLSDIDIAVSGIAPEKFYSAVAEITGLSSIFKIDLIDMDDCKPGLKKAIKREGSRI